MGCNPKPLRRALARSRRYYANRFRRAQRLYPHLPPFSAHAAMCAAEMADDPAMQVFAAMREMRARATRVGMGESDGA